jgi:hypothetical protein
MVINGSLMQFTVIMDGYWFNSVMQEPMWQTLAQVAHLLLLPQ